MGTPLTFRDTPGKPENRIPNPGTAMLFWCKSRLLILRRAFEDWLHPVPRWKAGNPQDYPVLLAESRTPLWSQDSVAERALQQGKVQNLRRALRQVDGISIEKDGLLSFWKQIGRATSHRGYVPGRQLQEGCLIPAIGGGLCQLSNALYEVALQAGCKIVERHPHTRVVPGSAAAAGRDATVAWNYIDLRFCPSESVRIEARLSPEELIVRLWGQNQPVPLGAKTTRHSYRSTFLPRRRSEPRRNQSTYSCALPESIPLEISRRRKAASSLPLVVGSAPQSCASCGVESCFRHRAPAVLRSAHQGAEGRTAYLVEECWPEFQAYLAEVHQPDDILCMPLDGARWNQPRYGWETCGYASVYTATWQTLRRSLIARRQKHYGATRLHSQLESAANMADSLARFLTPDVTRLCVAQSLLPFLWKEGHLGGRHYTVLLTRSPLRTLHENLDAAFQAHPTRKTLAEFRAPDWLVAGEEEALAGAEHCITPHAGLASLLPDRTHLLDWKLPPSQKGTRGDRILFPGPTVARKGAYELRAVARALNLEIVLVGTELEGDDFWSGVSTLRKHRNAPDLWEGVGAVVQPALVEDQPRLLLAALASGIPVVATSACGISVRSGVFTVPFGDEAFLCLALTRLLRHPATASRQ